MGTYLKIMNFNSRKLLTFICSIQSALLGLIVLDTLNFQIPILRQLIGFIYLTFVPGFVIVRILRIERANFIELFTYSISLSLLCIMFIGFFINYLFHSLIYKPISVLPLILTLTAVVSILSLLCYFRDKNLPGKDYSLNIKDVFSSPTLFLCLIPLLSIIGAYLVNYYHTNILLMFFIISIVAVVSLVSADIFFPKKLYPFALFIIAISLLYHNSLSSTYLDGWDIQHEYYLANLVKLSGLWDPQYSSNINSMLSIVMLAPIYSEICNLDLTSVFKVIYPFLFSVLPLGVYHIYNKQIKNEKISFLAVFYFISVVTFYNEMLALARQQIAELFFISSLLVMVSEMDLFKKRILLVLFMFGLVTSHYGLSCLILISTLISYLFIIYVLNHRSSTLHKEFIFLFFVFSLCWYMYLGEGVIFKTLVDLFYNVYLSISDGFLYTSSVQLATSKSNFLSDTILKILFLFSQFLIVAGFTKVLLCRKDFSFSPEYFCFSFAFICILVSSVVTSFTGMNIHRLFHISSILLSLFCVIGSITVYNLIYNILNFKRLNMTLTKPLQIIAWSNTPFNLPLQIIALFFIVFLLFNVGFVQQTINDHPISRSLSRDLIQNSDNLEYKNEFYELHFPDEDVFSARWLSKNRNPEIQICGDLSSTMFVLHSYGMIQNSTILTKNTAGQGYIFLRYPNINYNVLNGPNNYRWNLSDISPILEQKNLIYSNQGSLIYI